jgi:DNA-binding beta-propeller fold protein YncE
LWDDTGTCWENGDYPDSGSAGSVKISSTSVVSTLAGNAGQYGNADGTGAAARFQGPAGVAVDGAGNVYVVDNGSGGDIRKIYYPDGVAVDSSGNVYVADFFNNTIRKITQ